MKTIYYNHRLAKLILFSGYHTIMLFGFILTKLSKLTPSTVRHEETHQRQYVECMILSLSVALPLCWFVSWWFILFIPTFYYLLYLDEWLVSFAYHLVADWKKGLTEINHMAYKSISFEREAKMNQESKYYLNERKPFAWFRYYRKI